MRDVTLLSDVDLAALMCSKVCHDIISPVGAIANGLEVLEEEDDDGMREVALDLIRRSARQASAKLQFCRMAFGASGGAGASLDMGEAEDVARRFIGEEKITLSWDAARELRPKSEVKLLLNMVVMAISAIPRGGTITVRVDGRTFMVRAAGEGAKVPEPALSVVEGRASGDDLDPRLVQVYYATRLAGETGLTLAMSMDGPDAVIAARELT